VLVVEYRERLAKAKVLLEKRSDGGESSPLVTVKKRMAAAKAFKDVRGFLDYSHPKVRLILKPVSCDVQIVQGRRLD
jgi:hypothetical protein